MRELLTLATVVALVLAPLPAGAIFEEEFEQATTDEAPEPFDEATIARDEHGVPHVHADSEEAMWHANGFAQAQDRLWAMDLLRHISYGEGASVVGPGGGILDMDLTAKRNLYNESNLEKQYDEADDRFKEDVEAYADGVNRAAAEMQATGEMPAEFPALQHAFEPWQPVDTVAVATFLLAEFGNGGGSEVANAQLLDQLKWTVDGQSSQAFSDLVWDEHPHTYPTIGGTYTDDPNAKADLSTMPFEQTLAAQAAADAESFGLEAERSVPDVGFFAGQDVRDAFRLGSNALVVGPGLSESDKAMVGGGPQMGYFVPQVPYELGLHAEDTGFGAEGIGITGAPGVIIGANDDLAWTVTSGNSDQADTVALPAGEEGDRSYTWDGETRQLDCREELHRVTAPPAVWGPAAAEDPANASLPVDVLTQEVCRADLSATDEDPETLYPVTHVTRADDGEPTWFFAEKSTSRMAEVESAVQWLDLPRAEDVEGFHAQFEEFSFTFNFNVAGVHEDGSQTACVFHVGSQPVRVNDLDLRLPTPAGDDWLWGPGDQPATLTGDDLPWGCEDGAGYMVNWNNQPQEGWSSGDTRELWGTIHRAERLDQEFNEALDADPNDKLNLDQVKDVLEDAATEDSLAGQIVPVLLDRFSSELPDPAENALEAWGEGGADSDFPWRSAAEGAPVDDGQTSNPDGEVYVDRGHTVYDRLLPALMDAVFGDELGDHVRSVNLDPADSGDPHAGDHGTHNTPFAVLVEALRGETTHNWCDDAATGPSESCKDAVEQAVEAAGLGEYASAEDIPRTEQHESPFTSLGLGPAFTIPMTNRATYFHFHVSDDRSSSVATLPPGASGHINAVEAALLLGAQETPEHMDDQLPLYVDFAFKDVPWTQADAEQGDSEARTLLVP